ncbi:MAG TPA: hypothetical protein VFY49_03635 [Myxococcota bacterium]|nr:hypothetical protein [Myxococcota bacterium]
MKRAAAAFAVLLGCAVEAHAQSPTLFVADKTAPLGTVAPVPTLADDDAGADDGAGTVTPVLLTMLGAALPQNVEIAGLELSTTQPAALALDTTAPLVGLGAPADPRDVVRWDPNTSTYSLYFDGAAAGVPANARIDAVSFAPSGALRLSFDTTVSLPIVGTVDDEDLVEVVAGGFVMVFDGSANGVPANLDLDAASRPNETSAQLLLSFDDSGVIAGIPFDDEDVLLFDPGLGTWTLFADSSLSDPVDWPGADLVALPEPGAATSLLAGVTLLAGLARRARTPVV